MIREMKRDDLSKLPALHATANKATGILDQTRRAFEQLFPRLYFDSPWANEEIRGLVSESSDGKLDAALGVARRPFVLYGQPINAAVSSELFVDPESRSKMVGIQILKKFLDGPQDIAIADIANDNTRQIWLRLGGHLASQYSANWLRVLKPAGTLNWALRQKPLLNLPARVAGVFNGPIDRLLLKCIAGGKLDVGTYKTTGEPLTPELYAENFDRLTEDCQFRPSYDLESIRWLWPRLDFVYRNSGLSRQVAVRDQRGELIGWFIYQGEKGQVGRVAQLVATSSSREAVFCHLLADAKEQGLVAVQGRVQPHYFQTLLDNRCLVLPRRTHVLIHSRDERLVEAFRTGQAFLSLLEGEAYLDIWNQTELALDALDRMSAAK